MAGALVLHKMCVSLQNKGFSCGIFGNNYDLEECAVEEVAQIFDIIYGLWLTSAALPTAEFAASKPLCFKNASHTMLVCLPHFLPGSLCSLCCLLMENTFQNKLRWLPAPAVCPSRQWRGLATRGSSQPVRWPRWPRRGTRGMRRRSPHRRARRAPCCEMCSAQSCSIDFHAKIYIELAERG